MRKFLGLLMILTGSSCAGQSTIIDTLCFPTPVIRKVLIAAEQKKVLDSTVKVLDLRIIEMQKAIDGLVEMDAQTVASYEKEIQVMKDQRAIFETEIARLEKENRKLRRKVRWTAIAGVLSTAGAFFIGLGGLK